MKKLALQCMVIFTMMTTSLLSQTDQLPANPEPGKCYVKCVTPDEFSKAKETILVKPAYSTLEIIPAVYETVEERVLIKEASKRFIFHPAEYETEEVSYVGKEGRTDLRTVAAKLNPSSQTVVLYPQIARWEYSTYPDCLSSDPNDCQVLCWKEYSQKTQSYPTQLLTSDATTIDVPVSENKHVYSKQVIRKEARVEEIEIPAEYAMIKRQVLKSKASVRKIEIPAVYKTVDKTVLTKAGGVTSWAEVDCKLIEANVLPIFWNFNSAKLTNAAKRIIDKKLVTLLNDQPLISVEIASHTDSRGNDNYNMVLSQRRADAVKSYIVSMKINANRVVSKGLGESRLKNNCANGVQCSENDHKENRRTEFRVIGSN